MNLIGLESVWFFLWVFLWAAFFITDGFDFGVGALYPFLGKSEQDKRLMINSLGPFWDGNEVWLVAAGGVTFAAFPKVYASMFSFLYSILMLILFALILRGVSFEFRHRLDHRWWKRTWDAGIFIGSFFPALLFGIVFANIFKGLTFDSLSYYGGLRHLLNPYGLLGGVLFLFLFAEHGALWLCLKTESELQERAFETARLMWIILVCALATFLIATSMVTPVFDNYMTHPALFLIPGMAGVALLAIRIYLSRRAWFRAWLSSALLIAACIFFGFVGLYPDMFPSSIAPAASLTAFNAASSPLTLKIMLGVVLVVLPVVLVYQSWVYMLFRGKVTEADLEY